MNILFTNVDTALEWHPENDKLTVTIINENEENTIEVHVDQEHGGIEAALEDLAEP